MSTEDYGQFKCEFCGKPYPWKPQFAGKKVRCQCGEVMVAPSQAPAAPQAADDDAGEYGLADDPKPAKPAKPASKPGMPMVQRSTPAKPAPDSNDDLDLAPVASPAAAAKPRPSAARTTSAPTNPMLAYQSTAKPREQAAARGDFANQIGGEPWRELWVPIGMCVLGLILNVLLFMHTSDGAATMSSILPRLGLTLLFNLVLSFAGILAVSRMLEVSFGHPGTAVLKLIAAILVPSALAGFAGNWIGHDSLFVNLMVRITLIVPLTEIALVVLFQIALDEAMYCVFVIYLVTDWASKLIVGLLLGGPAIGGSMAMMETADLEDGANGPRSRTPWVMEQIAERNASDALTYLKPGDRTIGALPPVQAIQLVQSFKDAGATEVLVHLPNTYRGYTLFIGLPEDEQKRTALIDLYKKTCQELETQPEEIFPKDKYLILHIYGGGDDTLPVMPDGSADDRPLDVRNKERQLRQQQQQQK